MSDPLERWLATLVSPGDVGRILLDDEVMGLFTSGVAQACFARGRYEDAARWARRSLERAPCELSIHVLFAASCGHLGRSEEAGSAIHRLLETWPGFSSRQCNLLFSGAGVDFLERLNDGLKKAGWSQGW